MSPWFQLFLILASVVGVLMWVGMTFWFSLYSLFAIFLIYVIVQDERSW